MVTCTTADLKSFSQKYVRVRLNLNRLVEGLLVGYDSFMNIALAKSVQVIKSQNIKHSDVIVIRGAAIKSITLQNPREKKA